jgi:hypothetical protein
METFISWSGPRSKAVAEAIRQWLPKVVQSARPWMSGEDISAGARWLTDVSSMLNNAKVGIICITPENQHNPWLLFEAGALSRTLDQTKVCALAFGMTPGQIKGPLSQFQGNELNRVGIGRVLKTINESLNSDREISPPELEEIIDVWWPKLNERLRAIPPVSEPTPVRGVDDQLEELLMLSREQLRRENLRLEASKERDITSERMIQMMERAGHAMTNTQNNSMLMNDLLSKLHDATGGLMGDIGLLSPELEAEFRQKLVSTMGTSDFLPRDVQDITEFLRELHEKDKQRTENMLIPIDSSESNTNAIPPESA